MQLDQISANVRNRTPWEGVDLGFVMARHWFWPLWRLWCVTAIPVTLFAILLFHNHPYLTGFVVWWLKPLYEPMLLFWLSRRLFNEELSLRDALGEWRRILIPRLLSNLTIRRFSPNRSFYMPVSHLEGLRGPARLKRLEVLSGTSSAGTWLTVMGLHIEVALEFSLLLMLFYLIPNELLSDSLWQLIVDENPYILWLINAAWLIAISIFAPFYVAGGFALYLTRRSQLEAWDLELSFRRIAPRFNPARGTAAMLLAALLVSGLALQTTDAAADEEGAVTHEQARQVIDKVLAGEDFGTKKTENYWKYIGKPDEDKDDPFDWDLDWNFDWVPKLAGFLEYVLWIGGALLLGWLLLYLSRFIRYRPDQTQEQQEPAPTVLFGLPVTPDSLPQDIVSAIHELIAQQQVRAALSLLYRATLVRLIHEHHLRIPESATEGECQRIVANERPINESGFFTRLTRSWIWCAYGNGTPEDGEIFSLISDWQQLYASPANA